MVVAMEKGSNNKYHKKQTHEDDNRDHVDYGDDGYIFEVNKAKGVRVLSETELTKVILSSEA